MSTSVRAGSVSDGPRRPVAHASGSVVSVALLLLAPAAAAQDVTARVTADRASVRLSESVRATLTVEGPAPLRVELPKVPLDPVSDRDWKLQPVGPPAVTPAAGGRQAWAQAFRLDPYVPGEKLPVVFAAVKVNGKDVSPGGFEVTVVSTVAKTDPPRPATGIEELPPPADPPAPRWPWLVAGAVAAAALAAVVAWRLRRKPAPVLPEVWAAAEFDRVERADLAPAARVERAAAVLREFVARRLGIPAPTLTTAELLAASETAGRPGGEVEALRGLLDRCDRAKYAGDVPGDDDSREVVADCRRWIEGVGPVKTTDPP
ncbi:MAG: hypothetical protein C0501_26040 [Isosphaera sp.]|nr:hypothetical protein [Isosphaera sp.]